MPVSQHLKIFFNILGLDWRVNMSGEPFEKHPEYFHYVFLTLFGNTVQFGCGAGHQPAARCLVAARRHEQQTHLLVARRL